MSDAPAWRTLAELGWNPPAIEPVPDPISWRLPASARFQDMNVGHRNAPPEQVESGGTLA